MRTLLALVLAVSAHAAVDGVVTNGTTGKPQPGATVTLMSLGGGMNALGTVKTGTDGSFKFDANLQAGVPHLVQAMHDGVTYNTMLQPNSQGSGLALQVFDSSSKAPDVKVIQHMILLEPSGAETVVNQSVIIANNGNVTLQDAGGTAKIWVPASVTGPVQVRIVAPQGMPITRQAEKGSAANTYVVRYPIKPGGETRVDFLYSLPATEKFEGKILHSGGPVRFVAPTGVTLEGNMLSPMGAEPQTKATVYELKGTEYALKISGTGSLRAASAEAPAPASGEEDPTGGIDVVKPRMYTQNKLLWVLGLTFGMLAAGFVLLYDRR
jgi:hypothetical protein